MDEVKPFLQAVQILEKPIIISKAIIKNAIKEDKKIFFMLLSPHVLQAHIL